MFSFTSGRPVSRVVVSVEIIGVTLARGRRRPYVRVGGRRPSQVTGFFDKRFAPAANCLSQSHRASTGGCAGAGSSASRVVGEPGWRGAGLAAIPPAGFAAPARRDRSIIAIVGIFNYTSAHMARAFSPADKPERTADKQQRRHNLRRVGGLFRAHRARLGAVLALIFLSAGLGMISPFLLRAVLDTAIPEKDTQLLTALVAGMGAIPLVTRALRIGPTPLSHPVGQQGVDHPRTPGFPHPPRLSPPLFPPPPTG